MYERASAIGILAHQGGWDEILLVALPLLVIASLLLLANRRVSAKLDAANAENREDGKGQNSDADAT
ncbi:MAG: hypothetical protein ACI8TP_003906 [Acidimicrobiales bacterium]